MSRRETGEAGDLTRERTLRLLRYLIEFVKLRIKVTRRVEQYAGDGHSAGAGLLIWFADLPSAPGCVFSGLGTKHDGPDRAWLEVRKQEFKKPPVLPEGLVPWVDRRSLADPETEPQLRQETWVKDQAVEEESEGSVGHVVRLEDFPDVVEAWNAYVPRWRVWAQLQVPKVSVQRLYVQLFRGYQAQQRLGETVELRLGLGLLAWTTPSGQEVRRHLVTGRAELKFDERRGVISVECPPPPEGARLQVENEFLEPTERPDAQQDALLQDTLDTLGDDAWSADLLFALESWCRVLHPDVELSRELCPPRGTSATPKLTFAPAVILRKRTVRSTVQFYQRMLADIEADGPIPFGLRSLVESLEDDEPGGGEPDFPAERGEARATDTSSSRVYFPLPTNAEQLSILEHLERRRGVLVQGPPGTGKSHTIANLICHFLAQGKRVLVTSETPRALRVLKDKIPEEVRPLCVSLLGADSAAFAELESSVSAIGKRHATWNAARSRELTRRLTSALDGQLSDKARVGSELRELRAGEVGSVTKGPYRGTPAGIARQVESERDAYEWLPLGQEAPAEPPVSNDEACHAWRTLRRLTKQRIAELGCSAVSVGELPDAQEMSRLARQEADAVAAADELESWNTDEAYAAVYDSTRERRQSLRSAIDALLVVRDKVRARPESWCEQMLADVLGGRDGLWKLRARKTRASVEQLAHMVQRADTRRVRISGGYGRTKVLADAKVMVSHLSQGGRWTWLGVAMGPARGRAYLRKEVTVDAKPADTARRLQSLVPRLETERVLHELWLEWKGVAVPSAGSLTAQVAELEGLASAVEMGMQLGQQAGAAATLLEEQPRIGVPIWTSKRVDDLLRVLDAAEAASRRAEAQEVTERALGPLEAALASANPHPLNRELRDALRQRDIEGWAQRLEMLRLFYSDRNAWTAAEATLSRLRSSAPGLAEAIEEDGAVDEPQLSELGRAWAWGVADRWLRQREEEGRHGELCKKSHRLEGEIGKMTGELAAELAWHQFLQRMNVAQRQNLEAWQVIVDQLGKGTGKRASRLRAEARICMDGCVEAIPAWVVPIYRVTEVFQAHPELFDVIIIDEASQTGIDGLFLYHLGQQIVVVGDHQQISPSGIGFPADAVAALQDHYLDGVPFRATLDATNSLYDHAKIRFEGKVVLREHFRCMPEIIRFSNELCYAPHGTPLIPLRTYAANRLQPVLARFVPEGHQEGTKQPVNRPEAVRLDAQLESCLKDPRYKGKTFGVISLLGGAQARLLQELLTEVVGPEEMERRSLTCGDAYAFQGDERDVVFLSMVSAGNARLTAQTGRSARQRFNVAASRARDQLWLFHSVKPEDLSVQCVRRSLLNHCLEPLRPVDTSEEDVCETGFEREVRAAIRSRGFQVRTQVPAGDQTGHRFRIDLVVEGAEARLAVECDGDHWHGPEVYEKDMARQRTLERAGWVFERVREGWFRTDEKAALAPVWAELNRLGIQAGGGKPRGQEPPDPLELEMMAVVAGTARQGASDEASEGVEDSETDDDNSNLPDESPAGNGDEFR